jgi:PST family polysaccharide transporter
MIKKIKNIFNTEDKKRLLSNFLSLSVLKGVNYILPLITFPYLVRVLGVEKFGLVMFAQSFIMFFNIFVDFGFNLSAVREVSIYIDDKDKLTEIFSSIMIIKFILIFVSLIILTCIIFSFEKFRNNIILYYLTFLIVIGQAMFPQWYFQGIEKMKYITIINVASKLLFTIAIFIFVHKSNEYLLVPFFNGLGFIIGGILSIYLLYTKFNQKFKFQKITKLIFYLKESFYFFLSRLSIIIYTSANTFILGLFTNNLIVGYYSIAEKLYMALGMLYAPLVQVLYPYMSKKKNIFLYKKIFILVLIINFILIMFFYFFGKEIFLLIFNQCMPESIKIFHILLIAELFGVPSMLIGYPYLAALGFSKWANLSIVYSSLYHMLGL